MLRIIDLHVEVEGNEILKGVDLEVRAGQVHAIMGPNGSGKSTLTKAVIGHPAYVITKGSIQFEINGEYRDLLQLETFERAREGLFLAFQYPTEISGVTNFNFLKMAFNSICKHQGAPEKKDDEFLNLIREKLAVVEMNEDFLKRFVNEGFSGGEKKKNEILQMAVLNPRLAFLDETDSGLDIDALKIVARGVNSLRSSSNAIVLVTHYQRLLDYIKPDFVHVLSAGKIVKTGDQSLALELEKHGYDWLSRR